MSKLMHNLQSGLEFAWENPRAQARDGAWAFLSRYRANAFKVFRHFAKSDGGKTNRSSVTHNVTPAACRVTPASASRELSLVEAHVELGLGNAIFIRGEGAGLSWYKGQPLKCTAPGTWIWVAVRPRERVVFQLLLNDLIWAKGGNAIAEPGERVALEPDFVWPEIPRLAAA